jgi:hypothetical protein
MKPYLNILGRILALASLWAIGGYLIGTSLEMIGFNDYPWRTICAGLNLVIGLTLFKLITDNPTIEQAFFGHKKIAPDHPITLIVRGLWMLPLLLLWVGVMMWLWAWVIRLIFLE